MSKDPNVIGIVLLFLVLNKKSNIFYDLHRITETLNRIDRLSSTVNSIPDLSTIAQRIGPMLSMLSSADGLTYDDYNEENRNAIF